MERPIDLSEAQRSCLLAILGRFAPPIVRVDVYGSRARGDGYPGSDVDLMLQGDLDRAIMSRIAAALADSYLSIFADVAAYGLVPAGRFRDAVDRDARTLFDAHDLALAPSFHPVDGLSDWYRAGSASMRAGARTGR